MLRVPHRTMPTINTQDIPVLVPPDCLTQTSQDYGYELSQQLHKNTQEEVSSLGSFSKPNRHFFFFEIELSDFSSKQGSNTKQNNTVSTHFKITPNATQSSGHFLVHYLQLQLVMLYSEFHYRITQQDYSKHTQIS